tara:strand:- start:892 stop:1371 length:480 start_codon:yes stop_codon:yes gene_type:complete
MNYLMSIMLVITSTVIMCTPIKGPYVSPELEPAYEEWIDACKTKKIPWKREVSRIDSILYDSLYLGYWGKCFGNKIIISSNSISSTDTFLLKLIMYHELGHCAFGYGHDDVGVEIMNSTLREDRIIIYEYFWNRIEENYFSHYQLPKTRKRLSECVYEE